MQFRLNILLLILLYCSFPVFSQEVRQINGQRFEYHELQTGARDLYLDSQGYLWIATKNGLVRYDGYSFHYTKENPMDSAGFKGIYVHTIAEDHLGGILVGTDHGLNYKTSESNNFKHVPNIEGAVYSIDVDEENRIYVSQGNQITILSHPTEDSGIQVLDQADLQDEQFIWRLFKTSGNRILGFGDGFFELNKPGNGKLSIQRLMVREDIRDISQGDDGRIFVLSDSIFFVLDPDLNIVIQKDIELSSSRAKMHFDRSGIIWLGVDRGFLRIEIDDDYNVLETKIYYTGAIRDIIEDRSGNIFFADNHSGIYKLGWNYMQYEYISLPEGFENTYTHKYIEDDDGNYWIGTTDGLFHYDVDQKLYKIFHPRESKPYSIPHQTIYSLLKDRNGNVWAGTGSGAVIYDKNSGSFIDINIKGLAHHMMEAQDGMIWCVADEILYSIDPSNLNVRSYEYIQGKHRPVSQVYTSDDNKLWTWQKNHGMAKYSVEDGNLQYLGKILDTREFGIVNTNWMVEDDLGRLWISKSIGVYVVDKNTGELLRFYNTTNSPLQQDNVYEITKDHDGYIWLKQHNYGSISIDPKDFEIVKFSPSWLYNTVGNTYSCVVAVGNDGKLFTDGNGEFCVFYPDSVKINTVPPKIALEELLVNDNSARQDQLKLKHFQNNILFEFSGLHFDNSAKNRYEYLLKGFDKDWVESGYERDAKYSALRPGTYSFYVKACNSDGVWSEPERLSTMRIMRPWFASIMAYIIYALILISVIITIYQIQLRRKIAVTEVKKLNEIDEFKNSFFTNISHEFRTPLTVISGLADNLDGKQGSLIRRNTKQILTYVNQILELSKIESNAVEVKNEQVDIITYSRYILYSFSSLADEKSIDIVFASELASLVVEIDQEKYTTILQNLLSNAIKFTPDMGKITLEIIKNKGRFELVVSDTGIGIPTKDLPNIFNRYYQANNQQSEFKGTGIGLALSRQLAELMNGKIHVASTPGKGTSFTVNLPLGIPDIINKEASIDKQTINETGQKDERTQVLLVEDNIDICIVIRDLLKANYEVFTADNGLDGLNLAQNNVPDIIISDVKMPGMDGFEMTHNLKKDTRTSHIPVILLTANADIDSRLQGLSHGAEVYLPKPFNNKELILHVQNLLQFREALRTKYSDEDFTETDSDNPEDKFISELRDLILHKLSDDEYGISEICKDVGVSRTQLHRKLTALTGKSVSIYVRDIRLSEGRKLIRKKEGTIAEIAYSTGFKDPNYFSRLYAEKYGYPPTQEKINTL